MPNFGGLTDREAAIDAIIRFVLSLDNGDSTLCTSSLTKDTVTDLTPFQKIGMNHQHPIVGRQAVVDLLMGAVGRPLDTTHMATNIRCTVQGDEAELTCCVLAQHFRLGEGLDPKFQEHYLGANNYEATIVRDGDLWKVKKLVIIPAWTLGNLDVMKVN